MKAIEQYFPVVLLTYLYAVQGCSNFKSVDENQKCEMKETFRAPLSRRKVNFVYFTKRSLRHLKFRTWLVH